MEMEIISFFGNIPYAIRDNAVVYFRDGAIKRLKNSRKFRRSEKRRIKDQMGLVSAKASQTAIEAVNAFVEEYYKL